MSLPLLLLAVAARLVSAHEHHEDAIPDGSAVSPDPIDTILWWHIFMMVLSFGIMFPLGMVLGMVRSRWHVPCQAIGTTAAITGWFLGHAHKGRQFAPNIHSKFAPILMLMLVAQVAFGVYLKLHLERGIHAKIRRVVVLLHGVIGKLMPVASWVQMLFGGITALGFCRSAGDHVGQCLAHFIMGSSFIAYGIIMCIFMLVGQAFLRRTGRSQEFWDSLTIAIWGCINTFTEHRWGGVWNHGDIQHTSMGVVWWCAGLLGVWLSRGRNGEPKRNLVPGLVIFLTGYAMSGHAQHLPLSTMVHAVFGYSLMAAGIARIIEVCFVAKPFSNEEDLNAFQHLPPFLLVASGFIFMSATEEQLLLIDGAGIDHVSYILILYSMAFLMYLFVQILLRVFVVGATKPKEQDYAPLEDGLRRRSDESQARQADEFELGGLDSDEEDSDTNHMHAEHRKP